MQTDSNLQIASF